jgi:hypothetical protein
MVCKAVGGIILSVAPLALRDNYRIAWKLRWRPFGLG